MACRGCQTYLEEMRQTIHLLGCVIEESLDPTFAISSWTCSAIGSAATDQASSGGSVKLLVGGLGGDVVDRVTALEAVGFSGR